jgi:hypothetical protein
VQILFTIAFLSYKKKHFSLLKCIGVVCSTMATGSDKPQKSVVYKRVDDTNVSLEGMSFAGKK